MVSTIMHAKNSSAREGREPLMQRNVEVRPDASKFKDMTHLSAASRTVPLGSFSFKRMESVGNNTKELMLQRFFKQQELRHQDKIH